MNRDLITLLLTAIDGLNLYIATEPELRMITLLLINSNHSLEKGRVDQLKEYLSDDIYQIPKN